MGADRGLRPWFSPPRTWPAWYSGGHLEVPIWHLRRRRAHARRDFKDETALVPLERIERAILVIRGHKVMLDTDLTLLYDVEIKALNRAVKRNLDPPRNPNV